jgi:hypothetical protein
MCGPRAERGYDGEGRCQWVDALAVAARNEPEQDAAAASEAARTAQRNKEAKEKALRYHLLVAEWTWHVAWYGEHAQSGARKAKAAVKQKRPDAAKAREQRIGRSTSRRLP